VSVRCSNRRLSLLLQLVFLSLFRRRGHRPTHNDEAAKNRNRNTRVRFPFRRARARAYGHRRVRPATKQRDRRHAARVINRRYPIAGRTCSGDYRRRRLVSSAAPPTAIDRLGGTRRSVCYRVTRL